MLIAIFLAAHTLSQDAVGPVRLGEPVPKAQLQGAEYKTSFYADAQPLEGFLLKDPAVLAIVDGPFMKWGMDHVGEAPPDKIKKDALKKAPKLKVKMLIVTSDAVATDKGARVGSTFAEVKAAHPSAEVVVLPGLWEEPSCIARDKDVQFFFKRCPDKKIADDEKAIRIVVRKWSA